jgi:transposase-like protein
MTVTFNEDKFNAENNRPDTTQNISKTTAVACPRCKNQFCDRVKRGSVVKLLLPWLSLKRYYCAKCSNRFYKRG